MELIIFYAVFTFAVYKMAEKRGRREWMWVVISILISPLAAGILLLVLGDAKN